TNDSSSYGFVLYGIKKGDLKNIDELIVEGIRSCFVSECVKPSIIERYLGECGPKPVFTKTANRKIVAHQNFFVERLYYDIDKATPSKLLQNHLALPINRQYRTYEEGYTIIRNKFHEDLKRHYGEGIYSCRVAELEIDLDIHTVCRRRILVPLNFPFSYLHSIIQRLFGWEDYHLHNFWLEWDSFGYPLYTLEQEELEIFPNQRRYDLDYVVLLEDVFPEYKRIEYHYDFGDDWTHTITLINIQEKSTIGPPLCIGGEGAAPPEDAGGAGGWHYMQEILKDPSHKDYAETLVWVEGAEVSDFDIEKINRRLAWLW
ncbi:MAG: plasmid pRiA4b ORF-3 family protein, partial [Spirochaetales bacterium]|nr:plasmid pRiA4b ORF-3 family protein [Spirochaetales bacterium]